MTFRPVPKPEPRPKKQRKPIKQSKGQSGQKDMFNQIWQDRPHISQISGLKLHPQGHDLWHWQFAHIISKGAYPSYKLNPDNICLMTAGEHSLWDNARHKCTGKEWDWLKEKEQQLIQQYHKQ